jgi:hypothetical protein
VRRVLCAVSIAAAGCDQLFNLTPLPDAAEHGACEPLPYDANRYHFVSGKLWGLGWSGGSLGARESCMPYAMDLIVLDEGDSDELLQQSAGAPTPFWLGVAYTDDWRAIDGCTPHLSWKPGEPATATAGQCVIVEDTGMASWPCNHQPSATPPWIQGLCETPRPSLPCRRAVSEYQLADAREMSNTAALEACAAIGMGLVEINSTAELDDIVIRFPEVREFWIDAKWSGTKWMGTTGCPLVFSWQLDEPMLSEGVPRCASADDTGTRTLGCANSAAAVCERSSLSP